MLKAVTLDPVEVEELSQITSLINDAYRGSGGVNSWTSEAGIIIGDRTSEALLREDLQKKPHAYLLKSSDDAGRTVGCVWLEPLDQNTWHLGSLAIDPEQQDRGIGRALLSAAEEWVLARGGTRLHITVVNVRDALIRWYLRRGYRPTGETEPFPYDDCRFGKPVCDDLEFVVLEKALTNVQATA